MADLKQCGAVADNGCYVLKSSPVTFVHDEPKNYWNQRSIHPFITPEIIFESKRVSRKCFLTTIQKAIKINPCNVLEVLREMPSEEAED